MPKSPPSSLSSIAVGYYRPHIPLWAPKRFFDRFKNNPGQLPSVRKNDLDDLGNTAKKWAREPVTAGAHASVLKHDQWEEAIEGYLACVTYIDHEVGRVLDALDRSPHKDNTLTDLCGVTPPQGLDGQSLAPLLRDPQKETKRRLITTFNPGNYSVRTDRWRYILYEDGSQELYNMKDDPNEWTNLAQDPKFQGVIKRLRGDLK